MKNKKVIWISLIVLAGLVLVLVNLLKGSSSGFEVNAEPVKIKDITEIVSASGRIQPQTKVDITSEVTGEIISLPVKEGDYVKTGQLLIVLDTVQLASDAKQAKYRLDETKARLEGVETNMLQAEEDFKRQEQLYNRDLTSEQAYKDANYLYLNAKSNYEATKAQAKQQESMYEKYLDYLSKTRISAPMSGIITYLDCEVGEIAAAQTTYQGRTLMTISNLDIFEVEVEVDETEIAKIELNQPVKIEVDAFPDTTFEGSVVEIGNTAIFSNTSQDQTTNFRVKVIFNESQAKIRPGMSATVDITTNEKNNIDAVPFSAIVMRTYDLDSLELARKKENNPDFEPVSTVQAAENDEEVDSKEDVKESDNEDSTKQAESGDENMDNEHSKMANAGKNNDDEKEREELKGVFVIRDGKARFIPVSTGIADNKDIEVTEGLNPEDTVITGPYRLLRTIKDGDEVRMLPEHNKGIS